MPCVLPPQRVRTLPVGRLIIPLANLLGLMRPRPAATYAFDLVSPDVVDGSKAL
jgi:hypothetical protein